MDEKKPVNPLDGLRGVMDDLWGTTVRLNRDNAEQLAELTRQLEQSQGVVLPDDPAPAPAAPVTSGIPAFLRRSGTQQSAERPAAPRPAAYNAPQAAPSRHAEPDFPPFEDFWRTADETVEWTDALAHAHPVDGLTSEHLWSFFHEHAEAVLNGELSAYLEVLKATNPLGDLKPYARTFNVRAVNADKLIVTFEGLPAYLAKAPAEVRRYLSGLALRCARDLMALLPVTEVQVQARSDGNPMLTVPFLRDELQKVRFSFVDPEQFAIQCGACFD